MSQIAKLSFGEFLGDIRLVLTSPGHRFAVIQERGASWGSMVLLLVPTYFAFYFVGGIYFSRDPFPGYSFILPLVVAAATVYLKLFLIHVSARIFQGRHSAGPRRGAFSDLMVVFGYTGVPSILALLLVSVVFLLIPQEVGHLMLDVRAVGISIMVALFVSLIIWNLILVVLALRTVYSMRDLKNVAAFILGSLLMGGAALGGYVLVAQPHVDIVYVRPILSARMLRFFASDPTSNISSNAKIGIHVDRLAYRLRAPERFELVVFQASRRQLKENRNEGTVLVGTGIQASINVDEGDSVLGRIVGLPGDTVELVNGNLRINGRYWSERYLIPENRSSVSLPQILLGPSEYLILPENRHLIDELKNELVVRRDMISGREILCRWPLGWWTFRPSVFLQAEPAAQ